MPIMAVMIFALCLVFSGGSWAWESTSGSYLGKFGAEADKAQWLCEFAAAWAEVDIDRGRAVLDNVQTMILSVVRQAGAIPLGRDEGSLHRSSEVREKVLDRSRSRVERHQNTAAFWRLFASLAQAWRKIDADRSREMLQKAAGLVRRMDSPRRRDAAFRVLATVSLAIDPPLAEELAALIRDPEYKAWAYRRMGQDATRVDPQAAERYFNLSFEAVAAVEDPHRRTISAARLARAWSRLNRSSGNILFTEAARFAGEIKDPASFTAGISLLGALWGSIDHRRAFELSLLLSEDQSAGRFRLFRDAALDNSDKESRIILIKAALKEAGKLKMPFERGKALIGCLIPLVPMDADAAEAFWETLPAGEMMMRSEALLKIIRMGGMEKDRALGLIERIEADDPRAAAFISLAEQVSSSDAALARKALESADTCIGKTGRNPIRKQLARAWVGLSVDKALEISGESAYPDQRAEAYGLVAKTLVEQGRRADAERAWTLALYEMKNESSLPALDRADRLKSLAAIWISIDPKRAGEVFELAFRMVEG